MMRPADLRTENERGGVKKLIAKTKFPANFSEKVDMKKVNMETMVPWITAEVQKYVGFDDEVLVGYVQSQLQPPDGSPVDPRAVQLNLMGFLEKHTSTFMAELWTLLLSAQRHPMGIPEEFIEKKREEIRQKKARRGVGLVRVGRRASAPAPPRVLRAIAVSRGGADGRVGRLSSCLRVPLWRRHQAEAARVEALLREKRAEVERQMVAEKASGPTA